MDYSPNSNHTATVQNDPGAQPIESHDLTLVVTTFLLGRVTMDEVCQFCVLDVIAPVHPQRMAIYTIGNDSLFQLVGSFGRGRDTLHGYSCLDNMSVGEELRGGRPLATFPLPEMRSAQPLIISELDDGPQVLWPLATAHRLVGVVHLLFHSDPDATAVAGYLTAIVSPIALVIDSRIDQDSALAHPAANHNGGGRQLAHSSPLVHPSMLGPRQDGVAPPRALSSVKNHNGHQESASPVDGAGGGPLTPRQVRVLSLMAKGMTNGQIARVLAFSESTVRQETMAIYRVFHVKGRAEAVEFGQSMGLIAPFPSP